MARPSGRAARCSFQVEGLGHANLVGADEGGGQGHPTTRDLLRMRVASASSMPLRVFLAVLHKLWLLGSLAS